MSVRISMVVCILLASLFSLRLQATASDRLQRALQAGNSDIQRLEYLYLQEFSAHLFHSSYKYALLSTWTNVGSGFLATGLSYDFSLEKLQSF